MGQYANGRGFFWAGGGELSFKEWISWLTRYFGFILRFYEYFMANHCITGFDCQQNPRTGVSVGHSRQCQPRKSSNSGHAVGGGVKGSQSASMAENHLRNPAIRPNGSAHSPIYRTVDRTALLEQQPVVGQQGGN